MFALTCVLGCGAACSDNSENKSEGEGSGLDGSGGEGSGAGASGSGAAEARDGSGGEEMGTGAVDGGAAGSGDGGSGDGGSGGGGATEKTTYVYVGSGDWGGSEPGKITVYELERATAGLSFKGEVAAGGLASFLAIDAKNLRLFATDEKNGGVLSFSIDETTGLLSAVGKIGTRKPVYLSLTPDADYLFAANYDDGSVDVYPIIAGEAQPVVETWPTGTNAHSVVMDPAGHVLVANAGSDTISRFTWSGTLTAQTPPTTASPSPRHIVFDAEGRAYVVSESDNAVTRYTVAGDGQLGLSFQEERLPGGGANPAVDTGADLALTPDGNFLYVSNRGGANTIAAFDLRSGTAVLIEHESSGGMAPRNISMDPRGEFLIVGNRISQNLAVFDIQDDGSLEPVRSELIAPSPFFVQVIDL